MTRHCFPKVSWFTNPSPRSWGRGLGPPWRLCPLQGCGELSWSRTQAASPAALSQRGCGQPRACLPGPLLFGEGITPLLLRAVAEVDPFPRPPCKCVTQTEPLTPSGETHGPSRDKDMSCGVVGTWLLTRSQADWSVDGLGRGAKSLRETESP